MSQVGRKTDIGNRLLAAIPEEERSRIEPHLETVELALRQDLYEQDGPIEYVYFPHEGVISLVSFMEDGTSVEFGTVGNEGMVGIAVLLGANTMPSHAFSQIPGTAGRIATSRFRSVMPATPFLQALLLRYVQALLSMIAQSAVCNRAHPIEERCARWLLMTLDRVPRPYFPLTQEFLSQMLGVRRPSVTVAAGMLQKAGLIRYSRGTVTILDRTGLEAACCPCYSLIRKEFDRLLV